RQLVRNGIEYLPDLADHVPSPRDLPVKKIRHCREEQHACQPVSLVLYLRRIVHPKKHSCKYKTEQTQHIWYRQNIFLTVHQFHSILPPPVYGRERSAFSALSFPWYSLYPLS